MQKKHKKPLLTLLLTLLLALSACTTQDLRPPTAPQELSAFEKVQRMLTELENYRAIATVEYRSNKGTNTYETIQHARITGEYRVEVTAPEHVAGSVTTSDNTQICQFNSRVNGRINLLVKETAERSEIFLTSFIKNYLQSDEISVSVSDMSEGVCTVLEANISGEHPYLATSRLFVDNETLSPVKMVIFDRDGAERIIVTYHVFEKNVELHEALFSVDLP
ncbi:MAG: hypothetical protein FWG87_03860 [Defluviitaleaceae bacterium]|nr:hypothetical protein [Defluviitaleaceae bacterium]